MSITRGKSKLKKELKKDSDYLLYLLAMPFLLPLIYSVSQHSLQYLGGWYFSFVVCFILFVLVFYKKFLLNSDEVFFTTTALTIFFFELLISFSYTAVSKYLAFYTPSRDPGIFFTMIQAILKGNFGYSSVAGVYHFGTHQNYILIILAPLYALFQSPAFLQFIGALVCWLSGIMLWKIIRLHFNQFIAICGVIAYYASPSNHFYGFRPELFYPLALFTLYYVCVTKQKLFVIILSTLLLMSVKEDAPLYIPGFIYLLIRDKNKRGAISVSIIAVLMILVNLLIVQPYFVHKSNMIAASTLSFFSQWGSSNKEIITNLISNPQKIIQLLFDSNSGVWYFLGYWLFIPILSPFVLLSVILPLCLFTVSNDMRMHGLSEYYAITPIALSYIGFFSGVNYLGDKFKLINAKFYKIAIILILIIHNLFYVRLIDLIGLDYNNMSTPQIVSIWSLAPTYRGRWQEFYPIDYQRLNDFEQLRQSLLINYKDANICPSNQIYPHLDYIDFPNLQPFGFDNLNQNNCVNVFAITGDIWPLNPDSLKSQALDMLQKEKCVRFGDFFYCDNLNK